MATVAEIFSTSGTLFLGNWELLALVFLLVVFAILLGQARVGSPATIVVMLFLSYALSLLGSPWVGFFYVVILATGVVISLAILQITKQQ